MIAVIIIIFVLFNDVVNFAPKFALNYLHFAFFAYLNLVHILLHHKICLSHRWNTAYHRLTPNDTEKFMCTNPSELLGRQLFFF